MAAKLKRQRLGVGGIVLAERNLQVAISDFDAVPTTTATLINHQKIPQSLSLGIRR